MIIVKETKLAEVILSDIQLLPIVHRLGINLGFGEKTVEQVCHTQGVDLYFFLEIVNLFCNPDYSPTRQPSYGIDPVVVYLHKSHSFFREIKFPLVKSKIESLKQFQGGEGQIPLIQKFFTSYMVEFLTHIQYEDEVVFPYSLMVNGCFNAGTISPELTRKMKSYSMSTFRQEHDDIESKLSDLRNILIKYLPPIDGGTVVTSILLELSAMEKELENHSIIEERILVPRVLAMEEELIARGS
jgi:Regulator of cell morphogenesis and NO signaling